MANQLDIIIRYLLDKAAAGDVEKGTKGISLDMQNVQKVITATNKAYDELEKQMKKATTTADFDSIERQLKDVDDQVNDITRSYRLQAKVLRAEVAASTSDYAKARLSQTKALNDQLGGISRAGLGLGLGITGGIFAGAATYVKNAKEATDVTREWEAAQRSLGSSGEKIGAVFAKEALPSLRQAAQVAGTAARFLEQNPGIVRAALNFGGLVTALSAVGLAVNKAVEIYTNIQTLLLDSKQVLAAQMQDAAADKQLAAARLQAGLADIETKTPGPRGGDLGKIGATVALYATTVLISAELGTILGNKIGEAITGGKTGLAGKGNFGLGDVAVGTGMLAQTPAFLALKGLNALGIVSDQTVAKFKENVTALDKFAAGLLGAKKILNVIEATGTARGTPGTTGGRATESDVTRVSTETLNQALKIYEDYKGDDLKLVQDHYADRSKIISGALAAEQAENTKYASSVAKINAQTSSALASAASNFAQANQKAEEQYNINRAKVIRDGNQEIEQIEADSKERIRKLSKDHTERVADLTAARDALGLAKENRKFREDVTDERRNSQKEVQQRRQDIAQRLADLAQSYEQERAQRLADYQVRVAEIQQHAREQLAELAQQHQAELQQIRAQKAAKIRELDAQFVDERKRRYQYFLQQIRDLDASLLGERELIRKHKQLELQELDKVLATERAKIISAFSNLSPGTTGTRTGNYAGGYATYGMHLLGDAPGGGPGAREYVIPGDSTRMLERLIGGQITPERLMSAVIYGGGGTSKSTVYNDNRRINSLVSAADRERMRQDAVGALMEVFQ
jgi:hypothetical protein